MSLPDHLSRLTWILLLLILPGCGDSQSTGTPHGKVTYDGKPVPDATIQLQSAETGHAAATPVNAQGEFRFEEPVPVGEYMVSINPAYEAPVAGEGDENFTPPERPDIPERYRSGAGSELKVTVEEGEHALDIQMTAEP